ncbi:MAG: RNA methyltransferase [Armatimonadota bacterium]|nr:RNA methyltransferase [Armatimonadota bacterium]MDW8156261.1 RNA methyltransferase [Armatimonadota bacterium]
MTGVRLADFALRMGRVEELLVVPGASPEVDELAQRAGVLGVPVRQVSHRVVEAISDVKTPQPVAAVVRLPEVVPLGRLRWRWLAVADGLQEPGNLGALVRTAHAAGFDAVVVLPNTADPFHPRALRGSAGSCLALPLACATPEEVCAAARVWVADPRGEVDYRQADYRPPVALVFGSEAAGARHPWPGARTVRVPLAPGVESLNVTAAAAVLMYEARRAWTA